MSLSGGVCVSPSTHATQHVAYSSQLPEVHLPRVSYRYPTAQPARSRGAQHSRSPTRFFVKPPSKRSSAPGASLRQAAGTQKPSPRARRAAAANRMSFIRILARETLAALGRRRKINGVDAWRWSRSSLTRASARTGQNSAAVRAADSALHLNMKYKLSLVLRRAAARARKETVYHYAKEPQTCALAS